MQWRGRGCSMNNPIVVDRHHPHPRQVPSFPEASTLSFICSNGALSLELVIGTPRVRWIWFNGGLGCGLNPSLSTFSIRCLSGFRVHLNVSNRCEDGCRKLFSPMISLLCIMRYWVRVWRLGCRVVVGLAYSYCLADFYLLPNWFMFFGFCILFFLFPFWVCCNSVFYCWTFSSCIEVGVPLVLHF